MNICFIFVVVVSLFVVGVVLILVIVLVGVCICMLFGSLIIMFDCVVVCEVFCIVGIVVIFNICGVDDNGDDDGIFVSELMKLFECDCDVIVGFLCLVIVDVLGLKMMFL